MKITVVGAGHVGSAISADLALKGHEVSLLKTSYSIHNEHFDAVCQRGFTLEFRLRGHAQTAQLKLATRDYGMALHGCDLVVITIQSNFHEPLVQNLAPFLDRQLVYLEPGYLATLYFQKILSDRELTFVEAESSPLDCRITEPGIVSVSFQNVRNPVGIYPSASRQMAMSTLSELGYPFVPTASIVESALHNPNLLVHTVGALMSIPRIEHSRGDYWMYKEVFTPSVWNIVQALDTEKMNILEKLGYARVPYVEACKFRNSEDKAADATAVFFNYAMHHSAPGPSVPNSRYLTEDIPEGLVLLESIGAFLNVGTPTASAITDLACAALGTNFRVRGRTIERLGVGAFRALLEESGRYASAMDHCAPDRRGVAGVAKQAWASAA